MYNSVNGCDDGNLNPMSPFLYSGVSRIRENYDNDVSVWLVVLVVNKKQFFIWDDIKLLYFLLNISYWERVFSNFCECIISLDLGDGRIRNFQSVEHGFHAFVFSNILISLD